MKPSQTRLELHVDVFEKRDQRALALPDLKPPQLVSAILQEFRELEYLCDMPEAYRLVKPDGTPLDDAIFISQQLQTGDALALQENEVVPPEGARRPPQPIYLREQRTGTTYKVHWLPAIIGRTSEHQPLNELVAIDLKSYPTGLRVSRRHIRLSEDGGRYYIENLSSNPVSVVPGGRESGIPVLEKREELVAGDTIKLVRSDIALKFIVRSESSAA